MSPGTVSLGKKHTLILSYDGELYACGCNAEGQLGSKAAQPDVTQPVDVPVRLNLQFDEVMGGIMGTGFQDVQYFQ